MEDDEPVKISLGVARGFDNPEAIDRPVAGLGDPDGHWHKFDALESSEVYARGKAEAYHWAQNRAVMMLYVPVPEETTRHDVEATLRTRELVISAPVAFGGRLSHKIDVDASHWYLDERAGVPFLVVELAKMDEYYNWADVFFSDDDRSPSAAAAAAAEGD
ncbi:hypothetical protein CTAYLR_002364 [Chrysophaeum taylorii]|uniref:CS domain-containing protein n=1 Tax=Chrysophaeum taylorii TaxID=2483200 RepID=A0AAD7XN81_9STRA|nr:hypothetical protein CTAYLR_002364 [Chrysophaeum taylorii]